MTQAKAQGDVLIVGINSDASVKRLKGERRPILNQDERVVMLTALAVVDYVTIFEEDTPLALIKLLQPQYWSKVEIGILNGRWTRNCRSEWRERRAYPVSGRFIDHRHY